LRAHEHSVHFDFPKRTLVGIAHAFVSTITKVAHRGSAVVFCGNGGTVPEITYFVIWLDARNFYERLGWLADGEVRSGAEG
jgi:phosphoheptose isomerase